MAGEVVHFEVPAKDVDRAQRFYSELFGWEFAPSQMPDLDYRMTRINDRAGAAVFPSENVTGHSNYYHDVEDMDASLAKVRELGGSAEDKAPVPGFGWFAACTDSEGNVLHLWQSDSSAGQ
jgi:predicted enzyme related to lactoylglutathione lyase